MKPVAMKRLVINLGTRIRRRLGLHTNEGSDSPYNRNINIIIQKIKVVT